MSKYLSPAGLVIVVAVIVLVGWAMTHRGEPEPGCRWETWYAHNSLGEEVGYAHQRYICDGKVVDER